MFRTLKRILIAITIVACGYYALNAIAVVQIGASFAKCADENKVPGKSQFKNEEEARAVAKTIFECMDRRNGWLARMFFDKNEANRNLTYTNN